MNNKGFLLAESLVVSTFVLTVLIFLFVQFKSLFNSFEDSYNTNTVEGIYNLNTMKKYLLSNVGKNKLYSQAGDGQLNIVNDGSCNNSYGLSYTDYCDILVDGMKLKTLIYTKSDNSNVDVGSTQTFINFKNKIDFSKTNQYRLIGQFYDGTYATIVYGEWGKNE